MKEHREKLGGNKMSAFLGPIHHWLYNKITIQEELTTRILHSLSIEQREQVQHKLQNAFATLPGGYELPKGTLEELIDESNIHGWLQEKVTLVEKRFAMASSEILEYNYKTLEELEEIAFSFGKELGAKIKPIQTVDEAYQLLNDMLLDGMPCDHINQVIGRGESELTFRHTACIHAQHWQETNHEVTVYYQVRDALIRGLFLYTPVSYVVEEDGTHHLMKNSITVMMMEHQQILRMVRVVRRSCYEIMNGKAINYEEFAQIIDFIRSYADQHHHGKEEKFLFQEMERHLGKMGENLIRHGMLVEHDLGRLHMKELEEALERVKQGDDESKLDVIANAISYTHLIERHIKKEDELVYVFAKKNLPEEILLDVNTRVSSFEEEAAKQQIQQKYLTLLSTLEKKYFS